MAVELPSSEAEVQALLQSAVTSRASHIRSESQTITMANVRRLLETDLGLETSALDAHKAFIRQLVDEVLLSSDDVEAQGGGEDETAVSEEVPKETSGPKRLKKKKAREENGSIDEAQDLQEEDVQKEAPKKKRKEKKSKTSSKEEDQDGDGSNVEVSEEDSHVEAPKKKQRKERIEEDSREGDEDGSRSHAEMSEDESDVSEVKKAKKVVSKVASVKPVQNKKIEHLKKVIKACGLTIPPQIYKRAKQQPDDKQDKFLIKELEEILSRRGLSSNPSDKEIKAVKQKLAREKDLEGIDTTNIILEPRGRRATSQLFAPVYNPPPVEYDSEEDREESSEDGGEGSEDEEGGKDFAAAEDSEESD